VKKDPPVQQDPRDLLVTRARMVLLELLEPLEAQVTLVIKARQENQDPRDLLVTTASLERTPITVHARPVMEVVRTALLLPLVRQLALQKREERLRLVGLRLVEPPLGLVPVLLVPVLLEVLKSQQHQLAGLLPAQQKLHLEEQRRPALVRALSMAEELVRKPQLEQQLHPSRPAVLAPQRLHHPQRLHQQCLHQPQLVVPMVVPLVPTMLATCKHLLIMPRVID